MTDFLRRLVASESAPRIYACAAGAGTSLIHALWSPPGASSYLAGAQLAYSKREVDAFLGYSPEKYVSEEVALGLALGAYARSALGDLGKATLDQHDVYTPAADHIGIGITASVASLKPHRGKQRFHVAVVSDDQIICSEVILVQGSGERHRATDDQMIQEWTLDLLGHMIEGRVGFA